MTPAAAAAAAAASSLRCLKRETLAGWAGWAAEGAGGGGGSDGESTRATVDAEAGAPPAAACTMGATTSWPLGGPGRARAGVGRPGFGCSNG